ncbi:carbohydrate ABC transporter permease [uncultured Sphaerochaeta sp.]|uniref:carbohydrate ABC transporter permease n=1 Tax=uncultured Sphaerochaeta sp. TaxID=886478 RepID=UPI002A0A64E3|nr:carbohydrate ABC transporter permease [uncultured Sphaerochaeta sp.]
MKYKTPKTVFSILNIINSIIKLFLVFIMAFPFFWMISTAFKTVKEAIAFPPTLFPHTLEWGNFSHVIQTVPIFIYTRNSIIVALMVLLLQYLIIVPAAYSLARYEYKGKKIVFAIVLMGMMIPQQITFVPVYMMFSKAHMLNSYWPLTLPFVANSFGIFMLRQYFMQIPGEVIEAAKLDNASSIKIMYKIMIPMARPALLTIGLLSFISNWNSYFWPLIMTTNEASRTLPVGIATLKSQETVQMWNYIMAGNVLLVIPIIIVYIFANKRIRNSFVYSGIK